MPLSRLFGHRSSGDETLTTLPDSLIESRSGKKITLKALELKLVSHPLAGSSSKTPLIPLVAVGGAGLRILEVVLKRLNEHGVSFKSAGIDLDSENLKQISLLSHRLNIGERGIGTASQVMVGSDIAHKHTEQISTFLTGYLSEFSQRRVHDLVFVLMSSGGTGTGVGVEVCSILKDKGYRPVPLLVLPELEVSTRERFNGAIALYRLSFASGDRSLGLTTIILDNQHFLERNEALPQDKLYEFINAKLGTCIADLLLSTVLKSSGYSTDLDEFIEVFRNVKGIGMLFSVYSPDGDKELKDLIGKNLSEGSSCDLDPLSSTRSYTLFVSDESTISAQSYRDALLEFNNSDLFHKLVVSPDYEGIKVVGVYTGYKLSSRLREFMKEASDLRVKILNRTLNKELDGGAIQDIDKLRDGDQIDVKTHDEVRAQLAEKASSRIRGETDE